MTVRVALVDDHQPFRERLRALLQRDRHVEIVLETSGGLELLARAPGLALDVVCMDIRLPGMSGVETTRRLLACKPGVRVIGLSAYADPHYVEAMLDAGAVGHFTKGDVGDALLRAIHEATVAHPRFGSPALAPASAPDTSSRPAGDPGPAVASLRPREAEVLRLMGQGLTADHIAAALSLEPPMVDVYRRTIARKLNLLDACAFDTCARAWSSTRHP